MNHTQTLIENVIAARAKEIIDFVEMDMDLDWAISYVKNSTTLSRESMDRVVEIVNETLASKEA